MLLSAIANTKSKTHAQKRKLALALRALRKEKGMTQKDIERNSTLTQPAISRLEAPTGSLPSWDTVMRYIEACNGHMLLGFSAHEFDEAAFRDETIENFPRLDEEGANSAASGADGSSADDDPIAAEADD